MYEFVRGRKLVNYASVSSIEKLRRTERNLCQEAVYIDAPAATSGSQKENRPVKEKAHTDLLGSTLY